MSPYKNFLNAATAYLNSIPFLRFLLSAYIFVFAIGGLIYLLGAFVITANFLTTIGIVVMLAGLLLTLLKEDMMTLLITSGVISLGSLVAWIIRLAGVGIYGWAFGGLFSFEPLFYFLAFGTIAVFVVIKSEHFKQMRANSAAEAQMGGITCPRCGGPIPGNSGFCPQCGAKNPAQPQYAAPVQPQYAPPAQPQYAPPAQPQYAPPAQPPVQSEPTPAQSEPTASTPAQGEPSPAPAEAPQEPPAAAKCVQCGAELPPDAVFCGKCGAKQ